MKYLIVTKSFLLLLGLQFTTETFAQTKEQSDSVAWIPVKDIVWKVVDISPRFSKGEEEWSKFIYNNLNMQVPTLNKAPKGKYSVVINFVVGNDGTLRSFIAETKNGYGMEEEAFRILKLSPKWIPGKINGNPVNSTRRQNITFIVE